LSTRSWLRVSSRRGVPAHAATSRQQSAAMMRETVGVHASAVLSATCPTFEHLQLIVVAEDRMRRAPGKSHGPLARFANRQVFHAELPAGTCRLDDRTIACSHDDVLCRWEINALP
jgi:hypothetical protein